MYNKQAISEARDVDLEKLGEAPSNMRLGTLSLLSTLNPSDLEVDVDKEINIAKNTL